MLTSHKRRAEFAVLGPPPTATHAQIIDAYRRLARLSHPDATGDKGPAAADRFTAVNDAYRGLVEGPAPSETKHPARPAQVNRHLFLRAQPPIVAGPVTVTPSPGPGPSAMAEEAGIDDQ